MAKPQPNQAPDIELRYGEEVIRITDVTSDMWYIEGRITECPQELRSRLEQMPFKQNFERLEGLECMWRETPTSGSWSHGIILGIAEGYLVFRMIAESTLKLAKEIVHPVVCGKCGRTLKGGAVDCIYCGWSIRDSIGKQ